VTCTCCTHVLERGRPRIRPAVAWWRHRNGSTSYLCRPCLDSWFDNADDDETLEPAVWCWLSPPAA